MVRDDKDEELLRLLLERYPAFRERGVPIVLQPEGDSAVIDYAGTLEKLAEAGFTE